jgi:hypothetical protein
MQSWTHGYRFRNQELSAVAPRFPPPPAQHPSATRRPGSQSVVLRKRGRQRTATARVGQVPAGIARPRRTHPSARDRRATHLAARLPRPAGTLMFLGLRRTVCPSGVSFLGDSSAPPPATNPSASVERRSGGPPARMAPRDGLGPEPTTRHPSVRPAIAPYSPPWRGCCARVFGRS